MRRCWDRLLVVRHDDRAVRRRGRAIVLVSATSIAVAVAFVPVFWLTIEQRVLATAIVAGIAVTFSAVVALARRGRTAWAAALLLLSYCGAVAGGAIAEGQASTHPVFTAGFVLLAGVSVRPRVLPAVLLACLGGTLALPLAVGGRTVGIEYDALLVYTSVIAGFAALVAAVNNWVVDRAFDEADAERHRAEDLAAALQQANGDLERRVAERTAELSDALRRYEALAGQLAELSSRDHLTGLANRRRLDAELDRLCEADPHGGLALAVTDLDHFKRVNDTHGHHVGDVVLQRVADVLARTARRGDVAARLGGEEFVLLMPSTTAEEAGACCERLRSAVAAIPFDDGVPGLRVTTSTGVAVAEPGSTPADLLRRADELLYAAKRAGKNRVAGPRSLSPHPSGA